MASPPDCTDQQKWGQFLAIADSYHDFAKPRGQKDKCVISKENLEDIFSQDTSLCELTSKDKTVLGSSAVEDIVTDKYDAEYKSVNKEIILAFKQTDVVNVAGKRRTYTVFGGPENTALWNKIGQSDFMMETRTGGIHKMPGKSGKSFINNENTFISIASYWDQSPTSKYQYYAWNEKGSQQPPYITGEECNSIQFYPHTVQIEYALKSGGEKKTFMLPKNILPILDIGVNSLCRFARQFADVIQTKLLGSDVLNYLIKKNYKNNQKEKPKTQDTILDGFCNFLTTGRIDGCLNMLKLLEIKRSGDYGQIAVCQKMNEERKAVLQKPQPQVFLWTIDRLCYLRAKHQNVPCILVSPSNTVKVFGFVSGTDADSTPLTQQTALRNAVMYAKSRLPKVPTNSNTLRKPVGESQEKPSNKPGLYIYNVDRAFQTYNKKINECKQFIISKRRELLKLIQNKTYTKILKSVTDAAEAEAEAKAKSKVKEEAEVEGDAAGAKEAKDAKDAKEASLIISNRQLSNLLNLLNFVIVDVEDKDTYEILNITDDQLFSDPIIKKFVRKSKVLLSREILRRLDAGTEFIIAHSYHTLYGRLLTLAGPGRAQVIQMSCISDYMISCLEQYCHVIDILRQDINEIVGEIDPQADSQGGGPQTQSSKSPEDTQGVTNQGVGSQTPGATNQGFESQTPSVTNQGVGSQPLSNIYSEDGTSISEEGTPGRSEIGKRKFAPSISEEGTPSTSEIGKEVDSGKVTPSTIVEKRPRLGTGTESSTGTVSGNTAASFGSQNSASSHIYSIQNPTDIQAPEFELFEHDGAMYEAIFNATCWYNGLFAGKSFDEIQKILQTNYKPLTEPEKPEDVYDCFDFIDISSTHELLLTNPTNPTNPNIAKQIKSLFIDCILLELTKAQQSGGSPKIKLVKRHPTTHISEYYTGSEALQRMLWLRTLARRYYAKF